MSKWVELIAKRGVRVIANQDKGCCFFEYICPVCGTLHQCGKSNIGKVEDCKTCGLPISIT